EFLERALREQPTSLVSIMFANNETGSRFPVEQACKLAHDYGALFHSDMVQALGKIPFSLNETGFDFASFSAHKFYALKGCGVLYSRTGMQLDSLIKGGRQERGRRAGTENALSIAALGMMADKLAEVSDRAREVRKLRDHMEQQMTERIPGIVFNGCEVERLPNCSSAIVPGVDGETLLMNLDMKGFAVSTGAACSSGSPEPSPTLLAMGLTREEAQSSLRLGLGWSTTREQVEQFVEVLEKTVVRLRSFQHGESAYGDAR
ncbi:MAG: cysteine desulfurase family protein, partial [Pseudomonadota bacterium]